MSPVANSAPYPVNCPSGLECPAPHRGFRDNLCSDLGVTWSINHRRWLTLQAVAQGHDRIREQRIEEGGGEGQGPGEEGYAEEQ